MILNYARNRKDDDVGIIKHGTTEGKDGEVISPDAQRVRPEDDEDARPLITGDHPRDVGASTHELGAED